MSERANGSSENSSAVRSNADLPPPRQKPAIRSVSPPFAHTRLHRFNYYIALFAVLLFALYTYRLLQWKADAGGWWNYALGRKPPGASSAPSVSEAAGLSNLKGGAEITVEQRINELASALGMPSKDLARAIADAVREHIPPASLSSISAHQSGEAVRYLVDPSAQAESDAVTATATAGFKIVSQAIEAAVGSDEPPQAADS